MGEKSVCHTDPDPFAPPQIAIDEYCLENAGVGRVAQLVESLPGIHDLGFYPHHHRRGPSEPRAWTVEHQRSGKQEHQRSGFFLAV